MGIFVGIVVDKEKLMGIDRDFDRLSSYQQDDLEFLKETLKKVRQDPNWQTRSVKSRELLESNGIEILHTGHTNLGRCYNQDSFEVRSDEKLPKEFINYLREIGMLGYGQEFWFNVPYEKDGKFIIRAMSRVDSSD